MNLNALYGEKIRMTFLPQITQIRTDFLNLNALYGEKIKNDFFDTDYTDSHRFFKLK
jgi:hypothetical protein